MSCATFQSPNGGPLGYLVEGRLRILNARADRFVVPRTTGAQQPRIPLVTVVLDDDGLLLDGLAERADGAMIVGFGVGHVPERLVAALEALATRVPVVLASRTGSGPVLTNTYGFPGSKRDLLARGLISAGFLDPYKYRVLLRAVVAAGVDRPTIAAAFRAAGGYPAGPVAWPWPAAIPSAAQGAVSA